MQSDSFCKYHPKELAHWFCQNCGVNFCIDCVPDQNDNDYPKCTLCRKGLTSLSIANKISPFWEKLSFFLSYPFQKIPFLFIVFYSLVFAWLPDGKIGLIAFVLLLFPLTEFLFELMEQVANGEKTEHNLKTVLKSENQGRFVKFVLAFGFLLFLIMKLHTIFGAIISFPLATFFVLGVPASIIILMMEKQLLSMLNPHKIIYIINLLGGAYFLLYAITLVSIVFGLQVNLFNEEGAAHGMVVFLLNVFSIYLIIVLFSMMGYLVFQFHNELNYNVKNSNLQSLKATRSNELAEVEIFIQEGRFEDAQSLLLAKIKSEPLDYKANEKLILLYAVQGNDKHMQLIAEDYFKNLIESDNQQRAADFYNQLVKKSIDYYPASSSLGLSILEFMHNRHQYQQAFVLIECYGCEPSKDQLWDSLALCKAKMLAEFEDSIEKAIELLNLIVKRSVNQVVITSAEKYLSILSVA